LVRDRGRGKLLFELLLLRVTRSTSDVAVIGDKDYELFDEHGYIVVERLLGEDEVARATDEVFCYMPSWEEYAAAPNKYGALLSAESTSAGSARARFPFSGTMLNDISVHDELVGFAQRLMGTEHISLEHSGITGKYAGIQDYEQNLHVDYGNHTLAYPQNPASSLLNHDLGCLIYYSDVTIDLGPTYVVSQRFTADELLVPRHRERSDYAWMYEHETPVTVPAGSAIIYSLRTFHRGSAMQAAEGARFSHHLGYRPAPRPYYDPRGYMRSGGSAEMDRFLTRATPAQRALVGFPPVGDSYWDAEMLEGVARRYPQMDMTPYRDTTR
jgi:ectoine hydroxylase-related dioxygenase (phytanoyl-CoA dioxygenase family)